MLYNDTMNRTPLPEYTLKLLSQYESAAAWLVDNLQSPSPRFGEPARVDWNTYVPGTHGTLVATLGFLATAAALREADPLPHWTRLATVEAHDAVSRSIPFSLSEREWLESTYNCALGEHDWAQEYSRRPDGPLSPTPTQYEGPFPILVATTEKRAAYVGGVLVDVSGSEMVDRWEAWRTGRGRFRRNPAPRELQHHLDSLAVNIRARTLPSQAAD